MELKMIKHVYFKGTELQARELWFNLATGHHNDLFLHINLNSSRLITVTGGKVIVNYDEFTNNEKILVDDMIKNGLAYIKEIGVRI